MNGNYRKAFKYTLAILIAGCCLLNFPEDDGLRHVGVAFAPFSGWGDVYPFSAFENFKEYDPWLGYDLALRGMADVLQFLPLSQITLKIILVKIVMLLFLSSFTLLLLSRSRILDGINDGYSFVLANIVLIVMLGFTYVRIAIIRPFAFGIFFLLYSIGSTGLLRGVLSSAILTLLYPYLSWFYILPTAFAHLLRGSRRFALGSAGLLIVFLALQPGPFWDLEMSVLTFNQKAVAIDHPIQELVASLKVPGLYLYLAAFLLLFPRFSREARTLNYVNLMILLYALPGLRHIRYLLDITLPLAFVAFSREILTQYSGDFTRLVSEWARMFRDEYLPNIGAWLRIRRKEVESQARPNSRIVRPRKTAIILRRALLALAYLFSILYLVRHDVRQQISQLDDLQNILAEVPPGAIILSSFGLQYRVLFVRPDLHLVPSCAISWPSEDISAPYVEYLNQGKVGPLMDRIGAQYFVENHDTEIDPREGRFLDLVGEAKETRLWKRN